MSIALMTAVWRLDLPCTEKMVLLALADAANDDGVTWIALKSRKEGKLDLMTKCSLSDRAIQINIKKLCAEGYLHRVEKPGRGVIYTVTPERDAPPNDVRPESHDIDPRTTFAQTVSNRKLSSLREKGSASNFDKTVWGERLEEAKELAGDAADLTRPAMHHARDLRALVEPASGEPCEWDEVLDAVRMTCLRLANQGRKLPTWSWVSQDALALRDKRLAGLREPENVVRFDRGASLGDTLAAERAEARRIALEKMGVSGGV